LWDSCFHALVWSALGSERGVDEVANALDAQADDGFVPHMTYWQHPDLHAEFWGRPATSVITQPPMYGHALAELARRGHAVPDRLVARARAGLLHLGRRPRTEAGMIPVFHPWETGCDDSPRWDPWFVGSDDRPERKRQLVAALTRAPEGHAVGSTRFAVGSVGFNALVGFNAAELATVGGAGAHPDDALIELADQQRQVVASRWRGDRWVDDPGPALPAGVTADAIAEAGAIITLDSLTALLVDPRDDGFALLGDEDRFDAPFGPRGVDRRHPSYAPDVYWRGPAWPQLGYLVLVAAQRAGRADDADRLARRLVDGAVRSGWAEFWDPETGNGLGARPQTWSGLALVAAAGSGPNASGGGQQAVEMGEECQQ
jgi:hypothetical protein